MKSICYSFILIFFVLGCNEVNNDLTTTKKEIDENLSLLDSLDTIQYQEFENDSTDTPSGPIPADKYSINKTNKFVYLAVYKSKKGEVWLLIKARSIKEIKSKYPQLNVYEDRPDWMSEEQKMAYVTDCLNRQFVWDIEAQPTGWIKELTRKPN